VSKTVPVAKTVNDYSAEEQARFRELFAPAANQHRRRSQRSLLMFFVGCGVTILCALVLPWEWPATRWIMIALIAATFLTRLLSFWEPRLTCPACCNDVTAWPPGSYCPQCGSAPLEPATWRSSPRCRACGTLNQNKGRQYPIRACTHCGVILDETGFY